ncbi:RNA-guided endonuclease InsQ/TnpB family protein (plasmid) [Anabaena sp. FACHB-709]|uniref:Transposase n=3 Tax=Bacteria TaxID=2 RepID=A0A1Z4KUT1_ANAVA|nr:MULTISPECIES: RNA-guided endonuclease TnpB family protein [Nostocaceae]BAY72657.1 transposase [Trichormus variabilis NIES-23]MBD2174358.1 IS200/IS605 family element transposase accessory protein TnpB [Anabaena cylindrica FACHB-318]MBD2266157.1 IS200/IS605 family element transposase accessory protein TnpB [Anabaena sp. FACHB-709]MBD2275541.1 IS200/IS605 family element transposase accessory protein TnpB [Nostoc sp. PCC 7120 = FACHB-418]MBD2286443.1 IS200/IS605 family element transposase acces
MIIYEAKAKATKEQLLKVNEALRTALFVRNSCLRYWIDGHAKNGYDLNKYTKVLSDNPAFPWVSKLNSSARQAMAERAWAAIARFFDNCKNKIPGKKGFPRFRKLQTRASVEYKQSGWSLSDCRNYITFTDKLGIGTMKLRGTRDLNYYQVKQIKRVRIVRRSDGIYIQFCIDHERKEQLEPTGKSLALDLGLTHFYTDSDGNKVENPRFLRKSEKALKKAQRRLSHCAKGSKNRAKARNRLGRKHLKLQRQRKDWCVKKALSVIKSADFVAYENLQVRNMLKNHKLAKSISDASWSIFTQWLEYFGKVYGRVVVAVSPAYTSIDCSNCGHQVHKTLSTRTHICPNCSYTACRDLNASINILNKGLELFKNTDGHSGIQHASGEFDPCLEKATSLGKSSRRKRKVSQ